MANDPSVIPTPVKKEITSPAALPVEVKPAKAASPFPEAARVMPAAPVKAVPTPAVAMPTPAVAMPTPTVVVPVAVAPSPAAPKAAMPTPAPQKVTPQATPQPVARKVETPAVAPKAAAPKVAKAVKAPKVAKVSKVAAAPKTPKPAKALKVKATRPKAPRKTNAVLALKPMMATVAEPVVELPRVFEAQMKKLQQVWLFKDIDTGDIHIANAELREVVESSQQAAVEGVRAINTETEQFIRHTVDDSFAAVSELMSAKSLPELFEAQCKLGQDALQALVEHGEKLNGIVNRTAYSAFRPLNDNLTQAMTSLSKMRFF